MAIHGMPGKFAFCLGENEEESVWTPLHVERGMTHGESAVTVVGSQGTSNCLTFYKEAESILMVIASAMADFSDNNYLLANGNPLVLLSPGHARLFEEQGFSKQAVKEWLFEHCKIPLDRFPKETSLINYEEGRFLGSRLAGQRHHRPGGAAAAAQRRGRQALDHRHGNPRHARQVRFLFGRE